jgi:hypothetical protein
MGAGNFIFQAFGERKALNQIDYIKVLRFSVFAFCITVGFYLIEKIRLFFASQQNPCLFDL